jgi:hypothetical protein
MCVQIFNVGLGISDCELKLCSLTGLFMLITIFASILTPFRASTPSGIAKVMTVTYLYTGEFKLNLIKTAF